MESFIDTASHIDADAAVAASAVAAPKRRGRPSKVAAPTVAMLAAFLSGKRATARLVVSSDTADGFSLVVGNYSGSIAIDYNGPSDRAFVQTLAAHKGTTAADGASILQFTGGRGGAYSAAEIVDALDWLSLAMSTDDTRARLCGIHFDGSTWVATDGHRLHRCDGMPVLFETARTVPGWAVAVLLRAIRWTRAESVTVSESATRPDACFTVGGAFGSVTVTVLAIDAQFPDYRQVMPQADAWSRVSGDAATMRAALKAAPLIVGTDKAKSRRLAFSADGSASAVAHDGARVALPLSGTVLADALGYFTASYIDDALAIGDGAVTVSVSPERGTVLDPLLIVADGRSALVMPHYM